MNSRVIASAACSSHCPQQLCNSYRNISNIIICMLVRQAIQQKPGVQWIDPVQESLSTICHIRRSISRGTTRSLVDMFLLANLHNSRPCSIPRRQSLPAIGGQARNVLRSWNMSLRSLVRTSSVERSSSREMSRSLAGLQQDSRRHIRTGFAGVEEPTWLPKVIRCRTANPRWSSSRIATRQGRSRHSRGSRSFAAGSIEFVASDAVACALGKLFHDQRDGVPVAARG